MAELVLGAQMATQLVGPVTSPSAGSIFLEKMCKGIAIGGHRG